LNAPLTPPIVSVAVDTVLKLADVVSRTATVSPMLTVPALETKPPPLTL
jgi:hypothetical protein